MFQYDYLDDFERQIVPGTTAGISSPGITGYPAGSPAPIFLGSTEMQPQLGQTLPGTGMPPTTAGGPFEVAPGAPTLLGVEYTQGYLRTLIGKKVRIVFLLGESAIQDRVGVLLTVGIDYLTIRDVDTNDELLCDIYSIRFVNVFRGLSSLRE